MAEGLQCLLEAARAREPAIGDGANAAACGNAGAGECRLGLGGKRAPLVLGRHMERDPRPRPPVNASKENRP